MLNTLESGIFDSIAGLPVHPLVVHFAVVLLPLAALGLIAMVIVPKWADRFGWLGMAALAGGTVAAFVAKESGQALASHMGAPTAHVAYGDLLPGFAIALLVIGMVWFLLQRRGRVVRRPRSLATNLSGVVTAVLALVVTGLTILVGHTGAQAAWSDAIVDAPAATATVQPAASPTSSAVAPETATAKTSATAAPVAPAAPATTAKAGYTLADVAKHADSSSCWSVVSGNVYDLTAWVAQHPGGAKRILSMCGKDATATFQAQHGTAGGAVNTLKTFRLGPLG